VDRAIVDDGHYELDLCLALARAEEIAQDLPGRSGRGLSYRYLESTEAERVRTEEDVLGRDSSWGRRVVPGHDPVGGQSHVRYSSGFDRELDELPCLKTVAMSPYTLCATRTIRGLPGCFDASCRPLFRRDAQRHPTTAA
jgi:hypothetical protein